MKIHSDSIDETEIRKAARITGVRFTRLALHGSRSRAAAFDVILTGSSSRRQNQGEDNAATWDEWGMFLGLLYRLDPALVTPYYADVDEFHWQTNGRFAQLDSAFERAFERGHNHRWEFTGESVTGTYWVHECKTCGAVRRHGDWNAVSA